MLFPVRCYDPENIDIIAAFGTFVKAFFQIPAQIGSAPGISGFTRPACCGGCLSLVGSGGGGVALQRDQAGDDRVDDPLGIREEILVELVRRGDPVARADDDGRRIQIIEAHIRQILRDLVEERASCAGVGGPGRHGRSS